MPKRKGDSYFEESGEDSNLDSTYCSDSESDDPLPRTDWAEVDMRQHFPPKSRRKLDFPVSSKGSTNFYSSAGGRKSAGESAGKENSSHSSNR